MTKAQTYVLALMQCGLWLAASHKHAAMSANASVGWMREGNRNEAIRLCREADSVSQRFFGRNASDLI